MPTFSFQILQYLGSEIKAGKRTIARDVARMNYFHYLDDFRLCSENAKNTIGDAVEKSLTLFLVLIRYMLQSNRTNDYDR